MSPLGHEGADLAEPAEAEQLERLEHGRRWSRPGRTARRRRRGRRRRGRRAGRASSADPRAQQLVRRSRGGAGRSPGPCRAGTPGGCGSSRGALGRRSRSGTRRRRRSCRGRAGAAGARGTARPGSRRCVSGLAEDRERVELRVPRAGHRDVAELLLGEAVQVLACRRNAMRGRAGDVEEPVRLEQLAARRRRRRRRSGARPCAGWCRRRSRPSTPARRRSPSPPGAARSCRCRSRAWRCSAGSSPARRADLRVDAARRRTTLHGDQPVELRPWRARRRRARAAAPRPRSRSRVRPGSSPCAVVPTPTIATAPRACPPPSGDQERVDRAVHAARDEQRRDDEQPDVTPASRRLAQVEHLDDVRRRGRGSRRGAAAAATPRRPVASTAGLSAPTSAMSCSAIQSAALGSTHRERSLSSSRPASARLHPAGAEQQPRRRARGRSAALGEVARRCRRR